MISGWIKLHRQITEWGWYGDVNTKVVFIHLLIMANHKDGYWKGKLIKRGQRATSLDSLSKETSLSKSKIRTALKKLILTHEIAQQTCAQHTVFTILSYESYQGDSTPIDTPLTHESHTNDTRIASNKNDKNEKNEKNVRNNSRFTPPNFEQVKQYCDERLNFVDPQNFIDHYSSNGWMRGKSKIKDWKACVRTWEKNSKPQNNQYSAVTEKNMNTAQEWINEQ